MMTDRMPEETDVKKLYKWKLIASRPVGHQKIRWTANVMKGIQAMRTVNWKRCARIEINGSQLLSRPKLIYSCSASMNEYDDQALSNLSIATSSESALLS
jgi:hypothetical protein